MPIASPLRTASLLLLVLVAILPAHAQDRPTVAVYGFVRAETFYDSHRLDGEGPVGVDEQYGLFPRPDVSDTDWAELGFSARQTRLGVRAGGGYALGAEVSGAIEADFFSPFTRGPEFTLRNAFLKLDWGTHEVIAGQYWSPLFTVNVFPGTVAFNAGAPFQPYARQPQLRAVWKPGPLRVIGALAGQQGEFADLSFPSPLFPSFSSSVPDPKLAQRASLPLAHLHVQFVRGESVAGIGLYGKGVRPVLGEDRFYAGAVQAYGKLTTDRVVFALKGTFGTDLTDHLMTGGYVASRDGGDIAFDGLRVAAAWVDVGTRGYPFTFGLFGGALANLGATDPFEAPYAAPGGAFDPPALAYPGGVRAATLDGLWRLAPRIGYGSGPARLALEAEVTTGYWAAGTDDRFAPSGETVTATNVRGLVAFYYFF